MIASLRPSRLLLTIRVAEGLLGSERGQTLPTAEVERLRGIIAGSRIVEIEGTNHYSIVFAHRFLTDMVSFLQS